MLDVDFLLATPTLLDRPLIYRYRSGILRTRVKKFARAIAEQQDRELVQCSSAELPSFCAGGSLFPSMALCDLPAPSNGRLGPNDISALEALSDEGAEIAILFVEEGHPLLKEFQWPIASRSCLIVEEPVVTTSTVAPILEYLVRQSEFVRNPALLDVDEFRSHFDDFIAEHERLDLPSFKQVFDKTVLLGVDPKTGMFLPSKAISKQRVSSNRIMQPLRGLVERADPSQLPELLHGLAIRFPSGCTGRELADELARHAQTLFKSGVGDQSRRRSRTGRCRIDALPQPYTPKTNVWLWAAIVLAFTPQLIRVKLEIAGRRPVADLSLVTVDQIGREFLRRLPDERGGDPLARLWSVLEEVVLRVRKETKEEPTVQGKLVRLLEAQLRVPFAGEPSWVSSFRTILTAEQTHEDQQKSTQSQSSDQQDYLPHRKPQTFADVIGHQTTVEALQNRLQQNESAPLILYGPEGVGKRTLARIYAKGLLCEGFSDQSPAPCGRCEPCKQFDAGASLDFIEFDASAPYAMDYVQRQLLTNLRYKSFARRRPVLIANPEKSSRLVDMCLKTLETHSELTRFIFTVSDLRAMSDTGKSRCDVYRLAPLNSFDATKLAKQFLESSPVSINEWALDLVVAEAGGLPRRLLELSDEILSTKAITVAQVRRALKLYWATDAISFCGTMLMLHKAQEYAPELPSGWSRRETVRRVRSVLAEIYSVYECGNTQRPAFLYLDGDPISDLMLAISNQATGLDISFSDLWAEISRLWVVDHHSPRRLWEETQLLMKRPEVEDTLPAIVKAN